jgi:hypothetical protein
VAIPRTNVRLDYAHVTDFRPDLERASAVDGVARDALRDDDYLKLAVTHRLTSTLRFLAQASTFEGSSSRLTGDLLFRDPDLDLSARLRYIAQLGAYRDLSIQFTPLDEALDRYEPYHEVLLDLRKGIGAHLYLGGGAALRELAHESDEGPFNHEFRRFFAEAGIENWPWEGLSVSLLGEHYRSQATDRSWQGSIDVAQAVGAVTVGGGTSYSLYRFDEFFLIERDDVRTYFAKLEWRPRDWLRFRLSYSFEDDDEDEYHVARCDVRLSF